jgi:hypothetical protein
MKLFFCLHHYHTLKPDHTPIFLKNRHFFKKILQILLIQKYNNV